MEGGPVYGVIPPAAALYGPYLQALHGPNPYHNRRRSPHQVLRQDEERSRTIRKNDENTREKTAPTTTKKKKKEKEREITEEELERTYTGLDREIAEEFISIAMQPRDSPSELNRSRLSQEI